MWRSDLIDTDVLIIGCGPSGLTAAAALARSGLRVRMVTKHRQLAPTPRAHVTNQRSFEILRDLGVEAQAMALAIGYDRMPDQVFMRALSGPEFGRIRGMGTEGGNVDASPCAMADLAQNLLEPVLFDAAVGFGALAHFGTQLTAFTQDEEGVTAELFARDSGESITVRARYMIGADGGRSMVANALGLPFEGPGEIGGSLNILFECDLAPYLAHRPGLLFFLVRTAEDRGGAGLGILRSIKPWTSWLMMKGYAAGQETEMLSEAEAVDVIRDYLGIPDLDVRITGVDRWNMNALYATRYQQGRVLCVGDAVHRHVPSNGLGSNTGMQDAYNLAWKLALVVQGRAGASLLDSYGEERVPVGRQVVQRATRSLESYTPILDAIGVLDPGAPEQGARNMAALAADTPEAAARREALRAAIQGKVYEFQARGIELNQLYRSSAIIDEGQQPADDGRDPELFYRATSCPGARLPHAWVQREGKALSTLDLVGQGRFTLLTGIGGDAWIAAAGAASARLGIEIATVAIGQGCAVTDLYADWADRREIAEDGCLLVRPDGHVAWRCHSIAGERPDTRLEEVLRSILGLRQPQMDRAGEGEAAEALAEM